MPLLVLPALCSTFVCVSGFLPCPARSTGHCVHLLRVAVAGKAVLRPDTASAQLSLCMLYETTYCRHRGQ